MKLLIFSDTHGRLGAIEAITKKAKQADMLACAGDISIFEEGLEMTLRKLNQIGKPVLIIPGNHESPELLKAACGNFANLIYIHGKAYFKGDYCFIGFGSGGFSIKDPDFEKFARKLKIPKSIIIILVTHGPPYNTKVDHIWGHHGNKSYRSFIEKMKPVIAVSGHLHETAGLEDKIGRTRVINPGPKGKIVEI
jgi:uncharacterized protein